MIRLLTIAEAAEYCRLTTEGFRAWQEKGLVPGPIPGTRRWDRKALDLALDRLSGLDTASSAFKRWRQGHEGKDARG